MSRKLIRMYDRQPTLPLIGGTGCKSPFAGPIIGFKRISGESVAAPEASLSCAPNEPGVVLPTQNLAIPGALTQDALTTRPEDRTDAYSSQLYRRILLEGSSQVSAAIAQNPKFVIVELGANDILGIHSGVVIPARASCRSTSGQHNTMPCSIRLKRSTKQGLLVGLGREISKLSSLRRGSELWADRPPSSRRLMSM
jgi:hypothetical protein